jgi:hypothetical protein
MGKQKNMNPCNYKTISETFDALAMRRIMPAQRMIFWPGLLTEAGLPILPRMGK